MLSPKPWNSDTVVSLMLFLLVSFSLGILLAAVVEKLIPLTVPQKNLTSMIIMAIAFQGVAIMWVAASLKRQNISWSEGFGLRSMSRRRVLLIGIVAGIALLVPAWALHNFAYYLLNWYNSIGSVEIPAEQQVVVQRLHSGIPPMQQAIYFLLAGFLAPIGEEIVFRGIMYPAMKQSGYPRFALWGSSLLFAASHANLLSFLPLAFLGFAFAFLYEETDNLIAPIIAHSLFNIFNFVAITNESLINDLLQKF